MTNIVSIALRSKIDRVFSNFFILFFLLAAHSLFAQYNIGYNYYNTVSVEEKSQLLDNPWAGGLNNPQFSEIDLDGDSFKDLLIFDRDGETAKTFIHAGGVGSTTYFFAPQHRPFFPASLQHFVLMADFNCDGKNDLFTYSSGSIAVYENITTNGSNIKFQKRYSNLLTTPPGGDATNLGNPSTDIPVIADINNDGKIDILTFGPSGTTVEFHKNISGDCDQLEFELADVCWGKFEEGANSSDITLIESCKGASGGAVHVGSSLLALDMDSDNDMELVIGDIASNQLTLLTNGGSPDQAKMTIVEPNFPANQDIISFRTFPAAYAIDVNQDGRKDIVAAPNSKNNSRNVDNAWLYLDNGNSNISEFEQEQDNFIVETMIDLGTGARPVFFDHNGDGLMDIVAGNYGYYTDGGWQPASLALYENIGTSITPSYRLETRDYMDISALGIRGASPTFGDLDNDGDLDLLVGDSEGKLHLYLNNPTGNLSDFSFELAEYMDIDVGQFATPQLVDVNRDGTLDILCGEKGGRICYYENIGTQQSAAFNSEPDNDFFGEIDTKEECCSGYSSPFLIELEQAGKYHLLVAEENGNIQVYDQIENNLDGAFIQVDNINTYGHRINVCGANLDQDDKIELIYGEQAGGIGLLKKFTEAPVGINRPHRSEEVIHGFPNPAQDHITFEIPDSNPVLVSITVLDIMGNVVIEYNVRKNVIQLKLKSIQPGFYHAIIGVNDHIYTSSFVKL